MGACRCMPCLPGTGACPERVEGTIFSRFSRSGALHIPLASGLGSAMLLEERSSCWREPHDATPEVHIESHKSAIICIFPNRELGTGGPPGIHHFFVSSILFCDPLEKIQDQALYYGVGHGRSEEHTSELQ